MSDGRVAPTVAGHLAALAAGRFLRVVNYHDTTQPDRLRRALRTHADRFATITPADLDTWFDTGTWPHDRPGFIPVFYEGFRSAHDVAAPLCDELGITGWFAVCTGFVDCPVEEQAGYAVEHHLHSEPPPPPGVRRAMTWPEVADIARRHVVFPHTADHAGIAETVTDEDVHRQVDGSRRRLAEVSDTADVAFVWLRGTPLGVSPRHDEAVRAAGFRYLISSTMIQRL